MRTLHAQTAPSISVSTKRLVKLERTGRYEDGLAMFGENWGDPGFLPATDHLTAIDAAEIMLRFGSLIGFYSYKRQIDGGQERSKNILTDVRESYIALQEVGKIAECENHIALAYWRTGEYQESKTWIDVALSHDLPISSDARLYAHLTKSLISLSEKHYLETVADCLALEADFREFGDAFLNGSLCANLGVAFKNIFQNADAMRYFRLARSFHEKSRHKTYSGIVENNVAQLYKEERRFELAHEAADSAIKLYKQVKDKTREASTVDTKAQIYMAERRLPEALAAADKSIAMLRKSEISAYLAESLVTKSKILLFSDNLGDALLNLVEAVNITRVQNCEDAAKELVEEFASALKEKDLPPAESLSVEKDDLELVLPASIASYADYKGLWINTNHFENIGIAQGSLAIIVPDKIKRGDLVAISELENESVICGFYDSEFGIVCLERGDDDPLLFNEDDIKVLGKIVGVCKTGKDKDGKMIVEAIAH